MGRLSDEHFPDSDPYVTVFRALVEVLRKDAVLAGIDITWDVRRGDRGEAMPPSQDMMPWIAVVPLEIPLRKETEVDDQGRFRCRIDMAVAGTDWDDMGNLAGAVRNALKYNKVSPDDRLTIYRYLQEAGANDYWMKQAGVGVSRTEMPPADASGQTPAPVVNQVASAIVEFQMMLPTIVPADDGGIGPIG